MVRLRRSTKDGLICQHLLHRLKRPEDHPVTDAYQAPAPRRFDDLRIEQLGQGHPARLGHRACGLVALRLHPGAEMAQQRALMYSLNPSVTHSGMQPGTST